MPAAVLVRGGGRLFLVDSESRAATPVGPDPARTPGPCAIPNLPAVRASLLSPKAGGRIHAADAPLVDGLVNEGITAELAPLAEFRIARESIPWPAFRAERLSLLEMARRRFSTALASPEETLIALAREEQRMERVRSREQGAAEQWISPDSGSMREYTIDWERFRNDLDRHHEALVLRLEREAERTVPNLSAIVGARVAARLVAAAGGVAALGRMSSSRLQLLGARRRSGGNRGPKYGVLARTVYDPEVPPAARGAYARSVAALAVIAARADGTTRSPVFATLVPRRERRLKTLQARFPT